MEKGKRYSPNLFCDIDFETYLEGAYDDGYKDGFLDGEEKVVCLHHHNISHREATRLDLFRKSPYLSGREIFQDQFGFFEIGGDSDWNSWGMYNGQ